MMATTCHAGGKKSDNGSGGGAGCRDVVGYDAAFAKRGEETMTGGLDDPERALALYYAPAPRRAGLAALLMLDDTFAQVLRGTREPLVGQMRLTWWHDALSALDRAAPPAQPVLRAVAADVLPHGVSGARLAGMIEGWETVLDPDPLSEPALRSYAAARGAGLFDSAARVLGADPRDPLDAAGQGWALADLARHSRDDVGAAAPRRLARAALGVAAGHRWSRAGRALGALAQIARMDLALPVGTPPSVGAPGRVARLAFHRITGR